MAASSLGVRAAESDSYDLSRTVVLNVRRAFYDVLLNDSLRTLLQSRRALLQQLYVADSARVHAGDIPERALARSAVELARADADVSKATLDSQAARFALQSLLATDVPDTSMVLDAAMMYHRSEVPPLEALLSQAHRTRPDLLAADYRTEQSHVRQSLAASSLIPIPEITYVRQFGTPFDNNHFYGLGLSVEIPLLNQFSGQRERARAGAVAAAYSHERILQQIERDVVSARNAVLAQQGVVDRLTGPLNDAVKRNVTAAQYAYEHGATSLLELLDALRAQQDYQTAVLTATHDYWVALFTLDASIGSTTSESALVRATPRN